MALGQAIVGQLELSERGSVLDRWLAHHVAELMMQADKAVGQEKEEADARIVDIILKLWADRRILPAHTDPLGGYRQAIAILGALMPEANPWARYRGAGSEEALLRELFETMSRIVVGGILLTTSALGSTLPNSMVESLETEERRLKSDLDRWMALLIMPPTASDDSAKLTSVGATTLGAELSAPSSEMEDHHAEEDDLRSDKDAIRSAILENLKQMHARLAELLDRWSRSKGDSRGIDEEHEA